MASVTDASTRVPRSAVSIEAAVRAAYALGALALAGEAAVHVQQYASFIHTVRWIGPLFLVNAAACAVIVIGLAVPRTRVLAALAGVATSVVAIASLVVSYGRGLFGWHEAGFRAPLAWAVVTEIGAVILLTSALAGVAFAHRSPARRHRKRAGDERTDDSRSEIRFLPPQREQSA
ncbi:MAG: hypothetical protein QOE62_3745 [Actinomycetota bacterium]|nr:hypothetical protein [Actinomycetota bacterium]